MELKNEKTKLEELYPNKLVIENKNADKTVELICEVEPTSEHPEFSKAIAVLSKNNGTSVKHFHKKSTEIYSCLKGECRVFVDNKFITLKNADELETKPETIHFVECTSEEPTWIECVSTPGWTINDHFLVN